MRIRCVTINLKGLGHQWHEHRSEVLVRQLAALAPDIVFLQETALCYGERLYHQAAAVGDSLGLPIVAFSPYGNPDEAMSVQHTGIAIVARWPITHVLGRRLVPGKHPPDARTALMATLASPDGPLHVATTHLSWRPDEQDVRTVQMTAILEHFEQAGWFEPDARVLFTGDFNGPDDDPSVHLAAERLTDAFRAMHPDAPGYTWRSENPLTGHWPMPDRRLDYIFCSPGARVVACDVVLDRAEPHFASDHFGVFAEIWY